MMNMQINETSGTAERESKPAMLDHLERRHGVRPSTLEAASGDLPSLSVLVTMRVVACVKVPR